MDKFFSEFANDVYDVLAMNTDNITQEDFYDMSTSRRYRA